MKIIDARSGEEFQVGDTIVHPDGESVTLLDVKPGLLRAEAHVQRTYTNMATGEPTTDTVWVPLAVRWLHPKYLFQHIGIFPS